VLELDQINFICPIIGRQSVLLKKWPFLAMAYYLAPIRTSIKHEQFFKMVPPKLYQIVQIVRATTNGW